MWILGLTVVFSLLHLFQCQNYDDLAKDDCFKRIYICGDHRSKISGDNGELITNTRQLAGRCKANAGFMACIEEAERYCKGKLNDFSEMVLRNRKALKEICTEPLWGQRYINHAACINKNEKRIGKDCRNEIRRRPDGRPWWCLIPEPCEAIEKVFSCTIQKIEVACGRYSGDIYRKIQILKLDNQDVVCEFRRRNPSYCKYDREIPFARQPRQRREAPEDELSTQTEDISTTLDSIQSAVSEAVQNVAKAITIDVIESVVKTVESSAVQSEDEKCFNETLGKFFKEGNLLKGNVIADDDCQKLINVNELNSKSTKFLTNSYKLSKPNYSRIPLENFLKSICPLEKITEECFQKAKNMWKIARIDDVPELTDISNIVEHLQAILTKAIKLLQEESLVMDHTNKKITVYFDGLGNFALEELQCSLVSNKILKCVLDMESGCPDANDSESGQAEESSEHVDSDEYPEVLLVDSTESDYLTDLSTEDSWQGTTEASILDASEELGDLSSEVEDRIGDLFTTEAFNSFESEEPHTSSPLEILESNEKVDKSESFIETTTEFSILNTDKSYILLEGSYLPTESSTVYLAAENEDDATQVYLVSTDGILNDKLDSSTVESVDAKNIDVESPTEISTGIEEENKLDIGENDKDGKIIEDVQQQKLEEVLSEIFEVSNVGVEAPKLKKNVSQQKPKSPKDKMYDKLQDPFASKLEMGDMPSYKTMSLNGLADVYSGDSENLGELLQKLEFDLMSESSNTVDGSMEEQVSNTDKNEEPSTASTTESTLGTERSEL